MLFENLTPVDREQAIVKLLCKSKDKQWITKRTNAEHEIQELLPNQGVFIERHYFEEDEVSYRQYPMYAIFHGNLRLSPWYHRIEHLVHWVKPNRHSLIAFLELKKNLWAQRGPNEPFMRKAP